MEYSQILEKLGACGLNCEKCFAFKNGNIKFHSQELKKHLGDFDIFAQRFVKLLHEPVFEKYIDFKEMLNYFASVSCEGCRKTECQLFSYCNVRKCHKEKQVDFCFECQEFPCEQTGFDKNLKLRWISINKRIKEVGVEKYYIETRNKARY